MNDIQSQQNALVKAIQKERKNPTLGGCQSNWRTSVHFIPSMGQFSYDDRRIEEDVITGLLENKTMYFAGFGMHQGERCPRYSLS